MKAIAVAAQLANGKDVFCDYLVGRLNQGIETQKDIIYQDETGWVRRESPPIWERAAFANAVKQVFESSFGVDRAFIEEWKRNNDPPPGFLKNIRKSLQFIGDGFRQIKDEIWIEIALRDESKQLVISDSRYINEAKAVQKKGGIMFVLYRPGYLNDDPNPSEAQIKPIVEFCASELQEGQIPSFTYLKQKYGHICPDELQYYDYYLVNDGSIQDLYQKIDDQVVPYIKNKYAC